ncbi:MAG TPA: hypothetical protein VNZ53_30140 [Steroidobacteraceae bacterium]|jgi:hypothetical protein|nr:hypothetical protein [Steroidobacteraceae bacterium]
MISFAPLLAPRGVELDPLYVDVIAHCYNVASGQPAVLIETGESFDLLAAHRLREAVPI